ncbi:MAG: hypothetical protein GY737_10965, partial [Desulfobacteraceae bacterium]|nr:hypothetical protein [Desulfobacteraceae bacterium]
TKGKNRQSGRKSADKQSAGEGGNRKESEGQEEEAGGGASNTGPPSGPPGPPDPNERPPSSTTPSVKEEIDEENDRVNRKEPVISDDNSCPYEWELNDDVLAFCAQQAAKQRRELNLYFDTPSQQATTPIQADAMQGEAMELTTEAATAVTHGMPLTEQKEHDQRVFTKLTGVMHGQERTDMHHTYKASEIRKTRDLAHTLCTRRQHTHLTLNVPPHPTMRQWEEDMTAWKQASVYSNERLYTSHSIKSAAAKYQLDDYPDATLLMYAACLKPSVKTMDTHNRIDFNIDLTPFAQQRSPQNNTLSSGRSIQDKMWLDSFEDEIRKDTAELAYTLNRTHPVD